MQRDIHPLHAVLVSGTVTLFLGVLLCDLTYTRTFEIQWKNFSSWLLVGGLVFGGLALLWSVISLARAAPRTTRHTIYSSLLLLMWVLGFIDALLHAADAFASMSSALVLSIVVAVLAIAATWVGLTSRYRGATP